MRWAHWYEKGRRIVKRSTIGPYMVSTVFLGVDHRFDGEGPPILWETMVFGEVTVCGMLREHECERCAGSREQARAMHEAMCARVQAIIDVAEK